jgi:hypothetical protein
VPTFAFLGVTQIFCSYPSKSKSQRKTQSEAFYPLKFLTFEFVKTIKG